MECFITVSSMPYLELNVSSGRAVQLIQLKFLLSNCPMGNAVHTQAAERSVLTYRKKKCSFSVCFYSAVAVVFFFSFAFPYLWLPQISISGDTSVSCHVCMLRTGVALSDKIRLEAKVRPCEKMAMPVSEP